MDHLKRALAADQKSLFPDFLVERQEILTKEVGYECATMKGKLFGMVCRDDEAIGSRSQCLRLVTSRAIPRTFKPY